MKIHGKSTKAVPASGLGRRTLIVSAAAVSVACRSGAFAAEPKSPIAETASGRVRGSVSKGICVFRGVPYGASTAGANRFKPPQKPHAWTDVRDALRDGPSAPQDPRDRSSKLIGDTMVMGNKAMSEDCLSLNVYSPSVTDRRKRPVMLWLHGGNFFYGSGTATAYDGTNLAKRGDVVVVSINHRIGPFGFLYLGDLLGPEYADSGNAGMLDIIAALQWVRDNIGHFGGDPGNVTIFGQSGGADKVTALMAMPGAKGLFHKAIVESGASSALRQRTKEEAAKSAETALEKLGLSRERAGELLTMPMEQILPLLAPATPGGLSPAIRFSPTVDGRALARHPFDPDAPEISADVPMIIGTTETEYTFLLGENDPMLRLSEADMRVKLVPTLGDHTDRVIAQYKATRPNATPSELYWSINTEFGTVRGAHVQAARKAALGRAPAYVYEFSWRTKVLGGAYMSPHTIEIPFAFDNTDILSSEVGTDQSELKPLTNMVSGSWIAFAHTGNPNGAGRPNWPAYTPDKRAIMVIDVKSHLMSPQRLADLDAVAAVERPTQR
jgi:para-nitrobenzyl esterase